MEPELRQEVAPMTPMLPVYPIVNCSLNGGDNGISRFDEVDRDRRLLNTFVCLPRDAQDFYPERRKIAVAALGEKLRGIRPRPAAVGEIGLDYRYGDTNERRTRQRAYLAEVLRMLKGDPDLQDLPIVLHVPGKNYWDESASDDCLLILQECGIGENHRLYRHCFNGTENEAAKWIQNFPLVRFGASPKLLGSSANEDAKAFFASCSLQYVLVETDSPAIPCPEMAGPSNINHPFQIGYLYRWLAALRGLDDLMPMTREINANFFQFYGITP